jgi:hypothetical protein
MAEKIKGNPEQSYRRARRRKALESISTNETNNYTNRLKEKGYSDDDISKEFGRELTTKEMEKTSGARARINALMVGAPGLGAEATDPYLSRNEFKPGFYNQKDKPPTTAETMYGKGTKRGFESPIVDPDTSMMQNMAKGGSVRGQKNIQVKKKQFRGIF